MTSIVVRLSIDFQCSANCFALSWVYFDATGGQYAKCANAVTQKTNGLGQSDVEKALVRVFTQRIETGEFDAPETVSYRQIGLSHFNTSAARQLALETARQSVVLLKNIVPVKDHVEERPETTPVGFSNVGDGYCRNSKGRAQSFLCDSSASGSTCPGFTAASCAQICSVDDKCTGFMLQNMSIYS